MALPPPCSHSPHIRLASCAKDTWAWKDLAFAAARAFAATLLALPRFGAASVGDPLWLNDLLTDSRFELPPPSPAPVAFHPTIFGSCPLPLPLPVQTHGSVPSFRHCLVFMLLQLSKPATGAPDRVDLKFCGTDEAPDARVLTLGCLSRLLKRSFTEFRSLQCSEFGWISFCFKSLGQHATMLLAEVATSS